jgi:hypothetical protein
LTAEKRRVVEEEDTAAFSCVAATTMFPLLAFKGLALVLLLPPPEGKNEPLFSGDLPAPHSFLPLENGRKKEA